MTIQQSRIEFNYHTSDEIDFIPAVAEHGAAVIRKYMSLPQSARVGGEIVSAMERNKTVVDQVLGKVREQYDFVEWSVDEAPPATAELAARLTDMTEHQLPMWHPNMLRAQLYQPGGAGVHWHRDFKSSLYLVAAVNIIGEAQFDLKIHNEVASFVLEPGDVVLLRNTGMNQADDRVEHQVHAPISGSRLSLGLRQEK
jgi:alkylated DNA repair dioxygenase AlkB